MSKSTLFIVSVFLVSAFASNIPSPSPPAKKNHYLVIHNRARYQLGIKALQWDEALASYARNQTAKIKSANACDQMIHSGGPYGENVASGSGNFTGREAVKMWVGEREAYDYKSNSCVSGKMCGHYTQVVGRRSDRLGCARVFCKNGWWYVVCNYAPAGNILGQRPY